jgi:predicted transcriptional regulator
MIDFIEKVSIEFDEENVPVKKKMIGIKNAIRETDLIVVAADFMTKKKVDVIPIFNKDDFSIGVLTYENIVKCIATGDFTKAKKVSTIVVKHKFGFFNENTPMNQVRPLIEKHDRVYLVLNDNKRVVGWIV